MKNIKKGMSKGKKMMMGAGVAALGAGAYYLLGPKGKAHQKKVKELMKKMPKKKDVQVLAKKLQKEFKVAEKFAKKTVKKAVKGLK